MKYIMYALFVCLIGSTQAMQQPAAAAIGAQPAAAAQPAAGAQPALLQPQTPEEQDILITFPFQLEGERNFLESNL